MDDKTKKQIQEKYFYHSFESICKESRNYYSDSEMGKAKNSPKQKMTLIFKWYFGLCTQLALNGDTVNRVDYQEYCSLSLRAFINRRRYGY